MRMRQAHDYMAMSTHIVVSCTQGPATNAHAASAALMYACLPCSTCITAVCEPFQQPCACVNTLTNPLTYPLACVNTLTNPFTYPLACVNALTNPFTHPLANIHTITLSNPQTCPNIHTLAHTEAIFHTFTHTCSHTSSHTFTHACSYTISHANTHTSSYTSSHASTHACGHTLTHARRQQRCSILNNSLADALGQVSTHVSPVRQKRCVPVGYCIAVTATWLGLAECMDKKTCLDRRMRCVMCLT